MPGAVGCRQFSTDDLTHTALAFEHKGGWTDVKGAISVTVLQFLLGGGGSFSAGGPGERTGLHLSHQPVSQYLRMTILERRASILVHDNDHLREEGQYPST